MKICCCSRSYARALQSGGLTQLEWLDRCAQLGLDGVDFGAAHFPRVDADYLAQVKKLCVDRGLTAAGVTFDGAFGEGDLDGQIAGMATWTRAAVALGAPLVRFCCGVAAGSPGIAWRELIRGLKAATATAKECNVTLAVEARDGTLIAAPADVKRALKECDSAWLRFAASLDRVVGIPESDRHTLDVETILAVGRGGRDDAAAAQLLRRGGFIGFVSLETSGDDEDVAFTAEVERLRSG